MSNDLISRSALLDRLRGNVLIDVTPKLEKAIQEQPTVQEQGLLLKLPCRVGDTVYLRACCKYLFIHYDRETNASECPFENDCVFEECSNGNERLFKTTVDSIFNNGNGWYITLKGCAIEISIKDFSKTVFLTQAEAEEALKRIEVEKLLNEMGVSDAYSEVYKKEN